MKKVIHVAVKPDYVLALTFNDGTQGDVSMADRLFGPMFEPLKDPAFFAQAKVDEFGAVYWPNSVDLGPDSLYQKVKTH